MAIVNMLPGGGGSGGSLTIPSDAFPVIFIFKNGYTSSSQNNTIGIDFNKTYNRLFAPKYGTTSASGIISFAPLYDFTAEYKDGNNNTQTITISKSKTYSMWYYYASSTYYFKLSEWMNASGSSYSPLIDESSTTNRWSTYLLNNIQPVT